MARLENWKIVSSIDQYGNPGQRLIGNVYGHPKENKDTGELCNGNSVITNKLISLDLDAYVAVTQSGTVYELGVRSQK